MVSLRPPSFAAVALCFLAFGIVTSVLSAQNFLDQLSEADRIALGLENISPVQREMLEAAAQRYHTLRNQAAPAVAEKETSRTLQTELARRENELVQAQAELAQAKAALQQQEGERKQSLLDRAKVLLLPGTQIEYTQLESRLVGPFKGWTKGTRFKLENGQVWEVVESEYWSKEKAVGQVTILPGLSGSFFMKFEGVRPQPRVKLISN